MSSSAEHREKMIQMAAAKGINLDESAMSLLDELAVIAFSPVTTTPTSDIFTLPVMADVTVVEKKTPVLDAPTLRALIADTFIPEELGHPNSTVPEELLRCSDSVIIDGRRRLRLQPQARAQLFAVMEDNSDAKERYLQLLDKAIGLDQLDFQNVGRDQARCANAWLRSLLKGEYGNLDRAPVDELRAALQAAIDLQFTRLGHPIPTMQQVRAHLEVAELLEPMRLLVGSSGGWDGSPAHDRFVGRERELTSLRSHVDALDSKSWMESMSRSLTKLQHHTLSRRNPGVLMLQGRGGMGKSTLLAKFVLDHVRSLSPPVPLIYLDFDRASLQPCTRQRLLLESVRQVRMQIHGSASELVNIESQICKALLDGNGSDEASWWTSLRNALATHIGKRGAVLLLLDTMEVVQAIPDALDRVIEFIDAFGTHDFPQLRVVASGRADVPELSSASQLREEGQTIRLKPLPVSEAKAMAQQLGHDLLGAGWIPSWSACIAGSSSSNDARREPLTVRIAVELLRAETESGRDRLAREIAQLDTGQMDGFVGALYRRRVLAHLRDPQVQKLAWPGLVLRRINFDLVRDLLAPLCGLDLERLTQTYEALAREVWIVAPDGDGLRHLADLRSRTLPLMRKDDPQLFERVNRAAIEYFALHQVDDVRARAEWVYHRLLAGEPSQHVELDWCDDMASLLSGAADDFPAGSDAAQFLLARTSRRALATDRVLKLSPLRALEHIARCWPQLPTLDEEKMVPMLAALDLDHPSLKKVPSELRNVRFALMVKTGRWQCADDFAPEIGVWHEPARVAKMYLLGRSLKAWDEQGSSATSAYKLNKNLDMDLRHCEQLCREILSILFDGKPNKTLHALDQNLAPALQSMHKFYVGRFNTVPLSLQNLLRPVAMVSQLSLRPALRLLLSCEHARRERSYCSEEIFGLLDSDESASLRESLDAADPHLMRLMVSTNSPLPLRVTDPSCIKLLDSCLEKLLAPVLGARSEVANDHALRRFASARHMDCLVPLAYAASRATSSRTPRAAQERAIEYDLIGRKQSWISSLFYRRSSREGVINALRLADEAGDLFNMAEMFASHAEEESGADDLRYLVYCLRVRRTHSATQASGGVASI